MKELSEIEINLDSVQEGLKLWISSKRDGTLFDGIETAIENNEARFQLIEGCYYDYEISEINLCSVILVRILFNSINVNRT